MAFTKDASQGSTNFAAKDGGRCFVLENNFSFATYNLGSTETAKLFAIPARTFVACVTAEVTTAEGATLTIDVGDFSSAGVAVDADGYLDGVNCNSTSTFVDSTSMTVVDGSPNDTIDNAYANGKFYSAAGYIGLLCNNASADTAVVKFKALCFDMS